MPPQKRRHVLTVTALTRQIKNILEGQFPIVQVSGEVTDMTRPSSGHIYFTLKDQHAQIRAVVWKTAAEQQNIELKNGQEVICRGSLDVYPPRGSYQLVAQKIEPVGVGDRQRELRELKRRLTAEGLFDPEKKKPLPAYVRHIVIVTSPSGAAVRDFLEVARRRWRQTRITIAPVKVQGEGAGRLIGNAIRRLHDMRPWPDVMVVARGGGSVEDLWCFNEESLVRAVHDCQIPIVSAVGHEIDVSLCDLAADVRALTPSEAAELVLPSSDDMQRQLGQLQTRLGNGLRNVAARARARLERIESRPLWREPLTTVFQRQRLLDELQHRAATSMRRQLRFARERLQSYAAQLESLSPLSVLSRGYTVTLDPQGSLVADAGSLQPNDEIRIRFRDGEADAVIRQTHVTETPETGGETS